MDRFYFSLYPPSLSRLLQGCLHTLTAVFSLHAV